VRMTNIQLVRHLIYERHGIDRYPTVELNYIKILEELGELARNILRNEPSADELADVAISLYALSDKLNVDLDVAIERKVMGDNRRYAE
jgi:NTP pyrophosphatase (non-canonical NTP hydrolase)